MDRGRGNVKQLLSKGLTSVDRRKRGAPRHGRIAGQERHRETLVSSRTAVHTLSPHRALHHSGDTHHIHHVRFYNSVQKHPQRSK